MQKYQARQIAPHLAPRNAAIGTESRQEMINRTKDGFARFVNVKHQNRPAVPPIVSESE